MTFSPRDNSPGGTGGHPAASVHEVSLIFPLRQRLASLAIDQMNLGARRTHDDFVLVFWNVLVFIQPMLDAQIGERANENDCGHLLPCLGLVHDPTAL
jgi:hypothetical protein